MAGGRISGKICSHHWTHLRESTARRAMPMRHLCRRLALSVRTTRVVIAKPVGHRTSCARKRKMHHHHPRGIGQITTPRSPHCYAVSFQREHQRGACLTTYKRLRTCLHMNVCDQWYISGPRYAVLLEILSFSSLVSTAWRHNLVPHTARTQPSYTST